MADEATTCREGLTLDFKGKSIRALMVDGLPWFCLEDICGATNRNHYALAEADRPSFPVDQTAEWWPAADNPWAGERLTLLSPVGVFYWASAVDAYRLTGITSWSRREARRLCPNPTPGDPAIFLTLTKDADGWTFIPPGPPPKYSGYKMEWENLKWSDYPAWREAERGNAEWLRQERASPRATATKGVGQPSDLGDSRSAI